MTTVKFWCGKWDYKYRHDPYRGTEMRMPERKPKPSNTAPTRGRAVARWENEGGALAKTHKASLTISLYRQAASMAKKLIRASKF